MKQFCLGLLHGDGIGPEISEATKNVVEAAFDSLSESRLTWKPLPMGWEAIRNHSDPLPMETLEGLKQCDAWVMGPHDSVSYPSEMRERLNQSGSIRKRFDLYANIRPSRTPPGLPGPVGDMDLVIVRENTEGFYADRNMHLGNGEFMPNENTALAVGVFTRKASERIARTAFELAASRRKLVSIVHKANVLRTSHGLFVDCCKKVAREFPDVAVNDFHIDAMMALLVRQPMEFDVIVTTNMFGDILSDLAAELSGSLGMGGALNCGKHHAMAQASHGGAPDLAGTGKANPCGLILSAGMLLDWLGRRHSNPELQDASRRIENAVYQTLASGARTPDLGGTSTTMGVTEAIAGRL